MRTAMFVSIVIILCTGCYVDVCSAFVTYYGLSSQPRAQMHWATNSISLNRACPLGIKQSQPCSISIFQRNLDGGNLILWRNNRQLRSTVTTANRASRQDISIFENTASSPTLNPNKPPYAMNLQQQVYVWLTSIFVTCLITADVIGVKLFELKIPFRIFGLSAVEHTCGMLTFPVTFLLGDVINEYYGGKAAKRTVYLGLAMSVLVFAVVNVAQALPFLDKPFNVPPAAFNAIFGSAKLMYAASLTAYLVGQLCDIWLFGIMKRLTRGKMLWLRATGATLVSQLIDSFVVSYIAFGPGKVLCGQVGASVREVLNIAVTGYLLKFAAATAITPILYMTRSLLHGTFGLEPLPPDSDL
mmetsp:Transcript_56560/g.149081  ORF Transcript_56560/g.149081 Transcript_56560/m.149081 type:complete len:357 (-) Transcript_56560:161-1231(-)